MSSTETPVTKTPMGGTEKKAVVKERGSNLTPKSEMHVGRDWSEASWRQAFRSYCKKLDKAAYLSKKST